ncbi:MULTISPECIES: heavy-metal-associated domain-containing protein [Bacillales]|jgi:copper chaperone|uniref:Copper chaperone CopZ n=1 Tax=Exiguobacterium acetylicum TaxID=41170 RepID=A0ABX8GFF9_EXIAC|nr:MULTISPECIES: heavy-metal-associated domain-containing protein [Bacillales]QWB31887.1 heavy-metal-associated domain-containing protein [Exiguobacterium acetylicum]
MKETTLNVVGMSCSSCINKIEGQVGKLTGVDTVKVKLSDGQVDVSFQEEQVTLDEIKAAIQETGYKVADTKNEIGCSCCK